MKKIILKKPLTNRLLSGKMSMSQADWLSERRFFHE